MKRGSNSIIRTINLTDPWTSRKPSKVLRKFVNRQTKEPCPRYERNDYVTPRPTPVRVCTWKDIQRICPRRPCNWTPPPPRKSFGQKLWGLVWFAIKGSLVAAAIYCVSCNILWKGKEIEDLYYQIVRVVVPPAAGEVDPDDVRKMKESAINLYNQAVSNLLGLIAAVPLKFDKELRNVLHRKGRRKAGNPPPSSKPETVDRGTQTEENPTE